MILSKPTKWVIAGFLYHIWKVFFDVGLYENSETQFLAMETNLITLYGICMNLTYYNVFIGNHSFLSLFLCYISNARNCVCKQGPFWKLPLDKERLSNQKDTWMLVKKKGLHVFGWRCFCSTFSSIFGVSLNTTTGGDSKTTLLRLYYTLHMLGIKWGHQN